MARDFNQNRIANARLVNADIDKFGKTFAIQSPYNADGFSSVNVTVEQAPSDIKQYLEGDNSITVYPVPSNVDKLREYALASFPNIEDLYLFKTSAIVILEDDLSYLLDLNKIYVPTDLLSAYQSAYPTISNKFDIIVEDYTLTIPFVGDTTLTSEYVDSIIAMLSNAEKNAITKVVIPTDFTQESVNEIAWAYNWVNALPNCNNNIWYGATQYDFSVLTINGSGTLTSAIVESSISSITSDKLSGITKVVVSADFTDFEANSMNILGNEEYNVSILEISFRMREGRQLYNSAVRNKLLCIIYNSTQATGAIFYPESMPRNVIFTNATSFGKSIGFNRGANIYIPKGKSFYDTPGFEGGGHPKVFIGTVDASLSTTWSNYDNLYSPKAFYIPATAITRYKTTSYWSNYTNSIVGVIDGGNTYQNMFNVGSNFGYPTLTGIDTEANIQLLTPADGSLYLASDTGDLWQYDSANSQWVNLFANLTGIVWYSDEDCTTSVLPSAMDTTHTYYVKASGTIGISFANESWSTIKSALDSGIAKYKLGDTKTITYNNATYTIRICDLGARYDIVNGNGAKNKATFEFVELVGTGQMNTTNTNNGGFALSEMHTTTLPNIYNNLPSDLKAVIEQVEIASASDGSASGSGTLSYSSNYLFLPSEYEIFGSRNYSNSIEESQRFGYYATYTSADYRKKCIRGQTSSTNWWGRSPLAGSSTNFCSVNNVGNASGSLASIGYGVAPCFCL